MTVAIYLDKLKKTFADAPKQYSVAFDPSCYGGRNTMVAIIYSPHLDVAAYLPNQHLRQLLMSGLHPSFLEEAKASKLGTLEGYREINALSHALQAVGCSLMDFRLPKEIIARPVQDGETRVCIEGHWYFVNREGEVVQEHPREFDFASQPVLITYSDQGPSNTSALNFLTMGGKNMLVHTCYDSFHRSWNDVKLSCKRALNFPWKTMLQMVVLYNLNYSPFGSGAFFFKKQDLLEEFLQTRGPSDPLFQDYIHRICKERRVDEPSCPEEELELFKGLAFLKNFQRKGPCIKLLRWMSFFEVAMEWRGGHWATKMVLESKRDANEEEPDPLPEPDPNSKADDYRKTLADLRKTRGAWKLAPQMVTPRNIAVVDMLLLCCKACWKVRAERARSVVTPMQVMELCVSASSSKVWVGL